MHFRLDLTMNANTMNPDQTAPKLVDLLGFFFQIYGRGGGSYLQNKQ